MSPVPAFFASRPNPNVLMLPALLAAGLTVLGFRHGEELQLPLMAAPWLVWVVLALYVFSRSVGVEVTWDCVRWRGVWSSRVVPLNEVLSARVTAGQLALTLTAKRSFGAVLDAHDIARARRAIEAAMQAQEGAPVPRHDGGVIPATWHLFGEIPEAEIGPILSAGTDRLHGEPVRRSGKARSVFAVSGAGLGALASMGLTWAGSHLTPEISGDPVPWLVLACGVVGAWVGYVANTKRSCCTYVGARGIARSWMRNGVISRPEVLRWSEVQTLEQAARKDLMEWSTTHALRFERTDGTTFEIEAVELPGAEPEAAIHFVKAAEQSYRKASPERPGAR